MSQAYNNAGLTIRLVAREDLEKLAHIYVVAYNSLQIGEQWSSKTAQQLIEYLHEDQPDLFFVAEVEKEVVGGIVATVRPWWDGNHLIDGELFLHPDHQKKGIGVQLIKTLFTAAKEKYQVVSWDTYTHTVYENPLAWYKSLGFEEISHWRMITGNVDTVLKKISERKS